MNTRHQTYSQAEVDAWNLAHPVGTACRYEDGPGNWIPTKTRSEAWLLGHGVPVVKIQGKSGGYGIDCLSFPDLAEHYRTILQTIEGVIGTPPGTETDLNTLPERVAKAVVRVPDVNRDLFQALHWAVSQLDDSLEPGYQAALDAARETLIKATGQP